MQVILLFAVFGRTLITASNKYWTFLVNEKPQSEVMALLNCRNAASFDVGIVYPFKLSKFVIIAILANAAMTIWDAAFDIFFFRLFQPILI